MRYPPDPGERRSLHPVVAPALAAVLLILLSGCHRNHEHIATQADVTAAQDDARKEIDQARVEARKDVRNAVKETGGEAKNVSAARLTGTFDIAMAQADGDHKIALTKCMILDLAAQQPCKQQADAAFQAATSQAKAARVANANRG